MLARLLLALILIGISSPASAWLDPNDADVDVLLNTEDNQFAFYSGPSGQNEWLLNKGASSAIRIKGYDDPSAMKWDLSAYRGQVIEAAELHLCRYNADAVNALVVSTINTDWSEGTKSGAPAGTGDPCWRWRSYPDGEWTYTGSDFSTASFGNFGTLVSFGYQHDDTFRQYSSGGETWVAMKVDAAVIHAMILDNHGLVVTDPRFGPPNGNPRIYASEAGASVQPRLYLQVAATGDTRPAGDPTRLEVLPGDWNGEVVLRFVAPADPDHARAFGYTVRYATHDDFDTATPVERWRIPRPGETGTVDQLLIEGLTPGTSYRFWVQAYDKVGNSGNAVTAQLTLPALKPTPTLGEGQLPDPDPTGKTIAGVPGVMNYWACSELAKVNPDTGNRLEDGYTATGGDDYKKANAVWDAATRTITLRPVRNQVVGFQLIVQRLPATLTGVSVSSGDLRGPGGALIEAEDNIEWLKLHYTGSGTRYADPAIPLSAPFAETLAVPSENNPGGTHQSLWCDIYIPRDAAPGDYTSTITLDCNEAGAAETLNLRVIVASPVIPDTPTFLLDLNGYGNKWDSAASRYQVFQLSHKHRMVPNTLPYGWNGSVTSDRAPVLTGAGPTLQVADWSAFAANYGPFFDGSAFSPDHPTYPYHGPGENTAIANFYTTGSEAWPLSLTDTTYGYDAEGMGYAYWKSQVDAGDTGLLNFWLEAPDVMAAFPAGFAEGTRNVWQAFAQYAQDNGWTTAFQFYLNNKRSYSGTTSLWTLEEQYVADDFRANAWFMGLCREGWEAADAPGARFHWRTDTSSRWQQNWGQLGGIINLRVQGAGKDWDYRHDRYRGYTEQSEESRWWYGTGPDRTAALTDHGAQMLEHWSHGLDGGTPYWDNFRTDWTAATGDDADLSVLLSGNNVPGHGAFDGRIATVRMKAMRYGQQLCEMLNLMSGADDWNRNLAARALSAAYGDNAGRGYDAYGGDEYSNMQIIDYHRLHAELVDSLTANGCDSDSDGDGTMDCSDGCPSDSNKTEPGDCGCGVADIDTDLDGIADCVDDDSGDDGSDDTDSDDDGSDGDDDDASGAGGGSSGGGCFIETAE